MGRLSKDKRDVYYREAKNQGWRARSAFKLLQIDEEIDLLSGVRNVADLCAAPGGWSQVLAHRLQGLPIQGVKVDEDANDCGDNRDDVEMSVPATSSTACPGPSKACIVAVDQYLMEPIEGVVQVQGDITAESTAQKVLSHFHGEYADLVVCDGAPDVTWRPEWDEYVQHQLLLSASFLAAALLRPGGTFVAKIFRGEHVGKVFAKLNKTYKEVLCCKPRASRNSSPESFVVCRGFCPPESFDRAKALFNVENLEEMCYVGPGAESIKVPFVACGSGEDALDADTNYPVSGNHQIIGPLAPPVNAPYKDALEERRGLKRVAEATKD